MDGFPLVTNELAERIERHLAESKAAEHARIVPPGRGDVRKFGNVLALKAAGNLRMNGVYCFGNRNLDQLPAILAFYRRDGVDPPLYIAPTHFTEEVGAALHAAGYAATSFGQTMLYGLPLSEAPATGQNVTVEAVTAATVDLFTEAHAAGNDWNGAWREAAKSELAKRFGEMGLHLFLVRVDGCPAGCGAMEVRSDAASLSHGAVAPPFRGRGCQTALLLHRLHAAHQLGCKIIFSGADFGSTSLRNQLRVGLRLAYLEMTWRKL